MLKGMKLSEETKRKMSEAHKGKKLSESAKRKLRGIKRSAETRRKMSEAKRGKNNPMYGRDFSPLHRERLGKSHEIPLEERMKCYEIDDNGCWIWKKSIANTGYGQINCGDTIRNVHRVSYEMYVGPIPEGHHLHHTCYVRACMNPDHLEPIIPEEHKKLHSHLH